MFRVDLVKSRTKRKTKSFYGRFFFSKQKLKAFYGFLKEKYLKNIVKKSLSFSSLKGLKNKPLLSNIFLSFLERRLDVLLFRSGFFPSIFSARQAISHKHVFVNNRIVSFSSFLVSKGDVVSFSPVAFSIISKFHADRCAFLLELKQSLLKNSSGIYKRNTLVTKFSKHKKFKKILRFKKTCVPSYIFIDYSANSFILLKNFFDLKNIIYPFTINVQDVLMFYKV